MKKYKFIPILFIVFSSCVSKDVTPEPTKVQNLTKYLDHVAKYNSSEFTSFAEYLLINKAAPDSLNQSPTLARYFSMYDSLEYYRSEFQNIDTSLYNTKSNYIDFFILNSSCLFLRS